MLKTTLKVLSVIISSIITFQAASSSLEQTTVRNATIALIQYEKLEAFSIKCNYLKYYERVSIDDLNNLYVDRLKISMQEFKSIISAQNPAVVKELAKLKTIDCEIYDKEQSTALLYDRYDDALFDLDISLPLDEPFISDEQRNKQAQIAQQEREENYFTQLYKQAHSIAIGSLIYTKDVPSKYISSFIGDNQGRTYSYKIIKGWKSPTPQYIAGAYDSHETGAKQQIAKSIDVETVFFINTYSMIIGSFPVEGNNELLDKLGQLDWFWSGGMLTKY